MKREDVLKVDALKDELSSAFRNFGRELRGIFGEFVFAVDEVVNRYNALDEQHRTLAQRLDQVTERLLILERQSGQKH